MMYKFFFIVLIALSNGCNHLKSNHLLRNIVRRLETLEKTQRNNYPAPIVQGSNQRPTEAFSAYVGRDTKFKRGEVYIFDKVLLNINGIYNKRTGKASILSSGNYVITWHVLANGRYWDYPYLKVNGATKGYAACHSNVGPVRSSCGNSMILSLKRGDKIWIEERGSGPQDVQAGFSSFSVFKL